ncbi:hypothetical protein [Endozoicomonas numazuensis]|uniref:Uncharacterized protein n=1 Tax=Endozoicomonas numazuensis TaxID=1137799 RepID=A0A081NKI4_9GAMM|nr:hypothetical protein [Endozoicomonas numazuensis]KEQ18957.1 hypothetical protein GZ78_02580 [Endozoicomonas numazuensis]
MMIDNNAMKKLSESFVSEWLNMEYMLLPERIKSKRWACLPIADYMNPMEAEWLSEAINQNTSKDIISLAFEFGGTPTCSMIEVSKSNLIDANFQSSHLFLCITSMEYEFIYFKDQLNRFYLLSGSQNFLKKAYPCSLETSKEMYYDWLESYSKSDSEKLFLKKIWEKYFTA